MKRRLDAGQVIVEFVHVGTAVRVSAMDPVTLTEVFMVGDGRLDRQLLQRNVLRKLEYVMRKQGKID